MIVHLGDDAYIAVDDAGANSAAVGLFPHNVVIVPDLHDPVAFPEGKVAKLPFLFGRCGRIKGLLQELIHKIPLFRKVNHFKGDKLLRKLKYLILALMLILPLFVGLTPFFCKYICPAGTLEGGIALLSNAVNASYFSMLGPLFTWKFLLMVSILVGCIFIFRLFCRFICPLGAVYALFNKFSAFGIAVKKQECIDCGVCETRCPYNLPIRKMLKNVAEKFGE